MTYLHFLFYRPVPSSAKQKKKNNEDKPTYLPPEFVTKQALNSVYWYKSILLPSILHRFQQLLLAEDLRQTLVEKTGVGRFDITISKIILPISWFILSSRMWRKNKFFLLIPTGRSEENEYFSRTVKVPVTVQHISKIRNLRIKERKTLAESEKTPDLVRDINHCEDFFKLTVDDIKKYVDYVEQPLNSGKARAARSNSEVSECVSIHVWYISCQHTGGSRDGVFYRIIQFTLDKKLTSSSCKRGDFCFFKVDFSIEE